MAFLFRLFLLLNIILHTSQLYGRSPLCTRWCNETLHMSLNVIQHTSHIISEDSCCLSNSIKHHKYSLLWCVKIHAPNAPFPVTIHQIRMMCDRDILQFFCEDINQSMSALNMTYHYISSVTVSSSNRHPVCAGCLLSRHVLLPHLDPWRWDQVFIPKRRNGITTLCCVQSQNIASLESCSISVCPSIRRMQNGGIYIQGVTGGRDKTSGECSC